MGNVGSIEKVMVFGILGIIIMILGLAVVGANDDEPETPPYGENSPTALADTGQAGTLPLDKTTENAPRANGPIYVAPPAMPEIHGGAETDASQNRKSALDAPPAVASIPRTHTIQKGDTFEKIAVQYYDSRVYVEEILKANEDVDPRRLREGQVINLPPLDVVDASAASHAADPGDGVGEAGGAPLDGTTYVVREGDTLVKIAREKYGTMAKWKAIWNANKDRIPDPNRVKPGTEIVLP